MKRILSGVRPSGKLHLGNYLGAIRNWIDLQKTHEAIFLVVDLHGLTTPFDPSKRQQEIRDVVIDYIAAGVDPEKSIIAVQSHVPQHLELSWILSSLTPLSFLERIPTFKEKVELHPESVNLGLFSYPVLMAADILVYNADAVPVGEDQVAHIELARQLAKKFNHTYQNIFKEPKEILTEEKRIMSLKDPSSKMSKTGGAGIALSDSADEIRSKIKKAVTDTTASGEMSAGVKNLFVLMEAFSSEETYKKFLDAHKDGSIRYSDFKEQLGDDIAYFFTDFRNTRKELEENPRYVDEVLEKGAVEAKRIVEKTMKDVRTAVGL